MVTTLKLFDLAGADDALRFSPFCWRTRLALAHKGLPVDTIAWRFTEKEAIAPSGQGKVPVLVDGDRWLSDSWKIAEYLEAAHPDRPSLFGSAGEKALTRFVNQWTTEILHPALARVILPDVFAVLHQMDRAYFRTSREAAFGTSIAALADRRDEALATLRGLLKPLRSTLAVQPYLTGDGPAYADHIAFAAFQWARVVSQIVLVSDDDPIAGWIARMLDAYGGLARAARRAQS
jgi:glutathione S-transferase